MIVQNDLRHSLNKQFKHLFLSKIERFNVNIQQSHKTSLCILQAINM